MKASIIIPAYNEEKYIEKTLELALKQNYPDFEIIVVDNNSTDKTNELARKFDVKVFLEKNKGTLWTRERGRKEASGEVLAFLDADCLPDSDWLREGVKWFEFDKNVVAVTGPYDYFDSSSWYRFFSMFLQKNIYSFFNIFLQRIHKGAVLIFGNSFIRASSAENIGGFNTNITFYGDDTDTAKRLSKFGKIVFDKKLIIKSSSRRLKKEGMIKIPLLYVLTFFKILILGERK